MSQDKFYKKHKLCRMKLNYKLILKTLKGFYIPACLTDIGI